VTIRSDGWVPAPFKVAAIAAGCSPALKRAATARAEQSNAPSGSREAKSAARALQDQEDLLSDLYDFRDRLQRAANLNLTPDLDDGVVLTMAPLHELVPWKEPKKYWDELLAGKYEWSSIGKQLHEKGLVKPAGKAG